jgi:hypothetical protein
VVEEIQVEPIMPLVLQEQVLQELQILVVAVVDQIMVRA